MNAQRLRGFYPLPGVINGPSVSLETLICPDILGRSPSVVECARQFWTSITLGPRGWQVDCSGYESMGVSGNVEDSCGHAELLDRISGVIVRWHRSRLGRDGGHNSGRSREGLVPDPRD